MNKELYREIDAKMDKRLLAIEIKMELLERQIGNVAERLDRLVDAVSKSKKTKGI